MIGARPPMRQTRREALAVEDFPGYGNTAHSDAPTARKDYSDISVGLPPTEPSGGKKFGDVEKTINLVEVNGVGLHQGFQCAAGHIWAQADGTICKDCAYERKRVRNAEEQNRRFSPLWRPGSRRMGEQATAPASFEEQTPAQRDAARAAVIEQVEKLRAARPELSVSEAIAAAGGLS